MNMRGRIAEIYRHPVKGLTPERLAGAHLEAGQYFPRDREYAVEVGDSGFDPAQPKHISKQRFTVLARFPSLARLRTRLDDETNIFHIGDAHGFGIETDLVTPEGRAALERFLQAFLGEEASGQLRVLEGPGAWRFMDHPQGYVSVINLASVRAVAHAIGQPVDPLRFRANVYVEGWPAWAEDEWVAGSKLALGEATLSMFKPIVRCIATHVNLETGERDIDMVGRLREHFGRDTLGNYFSVDHGGWIVQDNPANA
ncbi:MAG TPA: MOSC N-terminal beta barrel domain-containing protein [Hyphomonadaceae bacterium]|nr:MOSC N-terminal beta barrel domain-containing protein [Hyphomonadaceae bacterium]